MDEDPLVCSVELETGCVSPSLGQNFGICEVFSNG